MAPATPPSSSPTALPTLEALRQFNRSLAMDAMLPPLEYSNFRQRLIFTSQGLETMLLRHVLNDAWKDVVSAKQKKKSSKSSSVIPWPRELRVVGSRVISNNANEVNVTNGLDEDEEEHRDALSMDQCVDAVCYFVRPNDPIMTRVVAKKIKRFLALQARGDRYNGKRQKDETTKHNIIFIPHTSAICEAVLREEEVIDNSSNNISEHVTMMELPIDLVPLDVDVLSMEMDPATTLRECIIDNIPFNTVQSVAASLVKLQDAVGTISKVEGLGSLSEKVIQKMMDLKVEDYDDEVALMLEASRDKDDEGKEFSGKKDDSTPSMSSEIEAMLIIDRTVDLVTPMLTPLTYEGLIDDIVGVESGHINIELSTIEPEEYESETSDQQEKVIIALNGGDSLYAEVRGMSVEKIGSFLQDQAKALRESHANFTNRDKSLSEIHKFVKHIPIFTQNYRSLTQHINLAALVKRTVDDPSFRHRWQTERDMLEGNTAYEELDELLYTQYDPFRLLKLLCLQSLTNGGIKSSRYDSFKRDIIQTYGYEFMFVLENIERLGMLKVKSFMDTSSSFATLRKNLHLINEEVNTIEPNDVAYVSSGYAPLSVRLLQTACQNWVDSEEVLREVGANLVDVLQNYPPEDFIQSRIKGASRGLKPKSMRESSEKPILMVYYVGGITFMEIHSLRYLSKSPKFPYRILICTTEIISGEKLLNGFLH